VDNILLLTIVIPLAAGFILLFVPRKIPYFHKAVALVLSALIFILSVIIFRSEPLSYSYGIFRQDNLDLTFALQTTALNKFILLFAAGFGVLICLYSLKNALSENQNGLFYGSLLLAIGGSAGILLSNHLLFLLIFWEIVTVSLYLLVVAGGSECRFAATKSFAMLGASDGALLLGIAIIWVISNTFIISDIHIPTTSGLSILAFLLVMTAAVTKAGAMPLHTWLPTSGECAPASVMAILPAALDKLLGIYLLVVLVKGLFVLQSGVLSFILAVIGAGTILIAVMIAMAQHNLKKLLSYHAVSQVGYMVLGIATMTPIGIAGGVFHMLNNAIYKCCLFLCGGSVQQAAHTDELEELGGLGKKMPWTFVCCLIASLSISGIPPLNGFVSKWMVYQGIIKMGLETTGTSSSLWPVWLTAAMFGSALTLASFVKLLHSVFLSRCPENLEQTRESPAAMVVPMLTLALLCVFFGVFYQIPLHSFIYPALGIEPGTAIIGLWDSELATALLVLSFLTGAAMVFAGNRKIRIVPTWTCGEIQPNDEMIIPGTHFYKTISSLKGLKTLYRLQAKEYFDLYNYGGKIGLLFSDFLKWLHSGLLPMYLTWVILGLLGILMAVCTIW